MIFGTTTDQGTLICSETSKKLYIVFIVLKDVLAVNATNRSESPDLLCYNRISVEPNRPICTA